MKIFFRTKIQKGALSIFGFGEKDSALISEIFLIFNFQLAKTDNLP